MPPKPAADALVRYLREHGLLLLHKEERPCTHTLPLLPHGGKAYVPPEAVDGFYAAVEEDLAAGRVVFVNEWLENAAVFKMHFELDYAPLSEDAAALAACECICAAVAEFFEQPPTCTVCAVLDGERARPKPMLRLVFDVCVSAGQALWIHAAAVAECRLRLPWGRSDWAHVLDVPALTDKVVRLLGADKAVTCGNCANRPADRNYCTACDKRGFLAQSVQLKPWRVLRGAALLAEAPGGSARELAVRAPQEHFCQGFAAPPSAPGAFVLTKGRGGRRSFEARGSAKRPAGSTPVELDCACHMWLEDAVRRYAPHFRRLCVDALHKSKRKDPSFHVSVSGFGERCCGNSEHPHEDGLVYFELSSSGRLVQRCTECRDYLGQPAVVPQQLRNALVREPAMPASAKRRKPTPEVDFLAPMLVIPHRFF